MFGELIKLREVARLLRRKRYAAALDLARDPAIREHKKAREAAEKARVALLERADQRLDEGAFDLALKDVRMLLRAGADERARALEGRVLDALQAQEQELLARAREKERARHEVEAGDLTRALERLQPLAEEDRGAASFARDLEARREREDGQQQTFARELEAGNLEQAFEAARELRLKGRPGGWESASQQLVEAALKKRAGTLLVRIITDARRRSRGRWALEQPLLGRVATCLVEQSERELREGEGRESEDLLAVFPLGAEADVRAQELGRVLRRLGRARRLFDEGQLDLAAGQAREAQELHGRCAAARELVASIERIQARSRAPLEKARSLLGAGQLVKARAELVALLEKWPQQGGARDLLRALEEQEQLDLENLAEARQRMGQGDLEAARGMLIGLAARRPDLEEVPVLLRDVERRARERRIEGFAQESRLLGGPGSPAAPEGGGEHPVLARPVEVPAPGRTLDPRQAFTLRVEERGDWYAHPGAELVLGNSMAAAADLPILAAIGSRHARIRRTDGGTGRAVYRLDPGPGKRVARNRRAIEGEVELRHGDLVTLGDVVSFTFLRPVPGNDTAVLRLEGNFLVQGCSKVVLFAASGESGAIVVGPAPEAHVPLGPDHDRVEILREADGQLRLLARCPFGIGVAGGEQRPQVAVRPGERIQTVDVDFFVDPA